MVVIIVFLYMLILPSLFPRSEDSFSFSGNLWVSFKGVQFYARLECGALCLRHMIVWLSAGNLCPWQDSYCHLRLWWGREGTWMESERAASCPKKVII